MILLEKQVQTSRKYHGPWHKSSIITKKLISKIMPGVAVSN